MEGGSLHGLHTKLYGCDHSKFHGVSACKAIYKSSKSETDKVYSYYL